MLTPSEAAADAVGMRLTRDECESLQNLLMRASEALIYLSEQSCAGDGKDDYAADADELAELAEEIGLAEKRYRDN